MDPYFPVRCTSCARTFTRSYEEFSKLRTKLGRADLALDRLGVRLSCCRTWYITYVPDVGCEYQTSVSESK